MRKRVIVPYIFICLILIPCSQTVAWANGSYADNSSNYEYTSHFATHDWIALKALEMLIDNDYSKWEWLKDREIIFLCGTEAPDNSDLNMTLDGELILGFGDFGLHHVYFYENGSVKDNEDDAAIRAQDCFDQAKLSLKEQKLDQAAFYFGAMTHYISDCSVYAHVAQNYVSPYNVDFDQWHSTLESRVKYRTNNYYDREDFFRYTAQCVEKNSAYNITLEVGWDTYKDPNPSEATIRDAFWLHNNFFSDWALYYDERITEVNETRILYYNRIEENLNKAIEGCVAAINYSVTAKTVFAEKDAHVYSNNPDSNYGDWDRMYCGNSQTYQNEVYIYFNISSLPTNWKNVDLYLYITDFPVPIPLDFKICQIMESWDDSSITWNNKPAHSTFLKTTTISKNGFNKIDVTSIISGDSFSICLYADVTQWETIRIHSIEHTSVSLRPKLICTYEEVDDVSPNIIIDSPTVNQIFGFACPDLNITIIEPSLNSTWYTLDEGLTNFTFIGTTNIINQSVWDTQPNGIITVRIYANDSFGNIGFSEVTIQKDTIAPIIIINSPIPNQLCGVDPPTFNVQIQEPNLLEKWYSLNEEQNITFTSQTEIDQTEWDKIGNGTVVIKFYAVDKVGNMNSSEVIIRKDAYVPNIIINSPIENEIFGFVCPDLNITIIEPFLSSTWYTLDGGLTNFTFIGTTNIINQSVWDDQPNGMLTVRIYANDSNGNIGFSEATIQKDTIAPIITINSPSANYLCGVEPPTFNIQIQEPNLLDKWYSLNEGENITFTSQDEIDQTEWDKIGNGTVVIEFYAVDKTGNLNSSEVIVRKDAYMPNIMITSPHVNETFGNVPPIFNISIISEDVVLTWYRIFDNSFVYPPSFYFNGTSGVIDQDYWNWVWEGEIIIIFYAQDEAGNIGTESVLIIKSIPSTSTDGFSPVMSVVIITSIVGGLGISVVLIAKYRKKIPNLKKYFEVLIKKYKSKKRSRI